MKRALGVLGAVVLIALPLTACGGPQSKSPESHACDELQPLLTAGGRTADQTRDAVTAVHGWSSQSGDESFKAAGQAMYTAYQTSRQAEFVAAVDDLAKRCRAGD